MSHHASSLDPTLVGHHVPELSQQIEAGQMLVRVKGADQLMSNSLASPTSIS